MTKRRTRVYSQAEKEEAVACWVIHGTFAAVENELGINAITVRSWRDREPDWWERVANAIREEFEEQHRAGLQKIIEKALDNVQERLNNGDERLLSNGDIKRVKVTAKDCATIAGISIDKLRISLGKPTTIKAGDVSSTVDKLQALRDAARKQAIESGDIADISPKDEPARTVERKTA